MEPEVRRLMVPRSARFATAGDVGGPLEDVWFLCHGYGQLASEFLAQARALEGEKRLLVAPEALSRFYHEDHGKVGASWMTREDRLAEIEDYVRYLDVLHDHVFEIVPRSEVRLCVLGFSQGVATAARWAVRGKPRIDQLVLWGSPLPPELDDEPSLGPLRTANVTLVGGSRDEFLGEKEREEQRTRLGRHHVSYRELSFAGGHRLDDETLRTLAARERA